MHSGNAAAMPLVRNAATLSFCHASRSVRITTAILVSNCMMAPVSFRGASETSEPGMTIVENLPPGVAGPGADHALLAAEFVAFARGLIQRVRNPGLDGIAVSAAGIGHVDRQRGAGVLHGHRGAFALAMFLGSGARSRFAGIIIGLAVGAAIADREG